MGNLIDCLDKLRPKKRTTHFSKAHEEALLDRSKLIQSKNPNMPPVEADRLAVNWAMDQNTAEHNRLFKIPEPVRITALNADDTIARQVEKETGFTLVKKDQAASTATPTPEKLASYTPEERKMLEEIQKQHKPEWEFTDNRPGSKTPGRTFRAPIDATREQMMEEYRLRAPEHIQVESDVKSSGLINGETRPLQAEDIDAAARGTYNSSKRGKTKADSIVQPAWFRVKSGTPLKQLFEMLLSDRGTPADAAKSKTKRLTAILDRMTDMVHIVSTWESAPGKLAVTIFDEDVRPTGRGAKKGDKSVPLGKVLTDHKNYEVLGSFRTKELTEFYHHELPRERFESDLAEPVQKLVDEVQRTAKKVEDSNTIDKSLKPKKAGQKKGAPTEPNEPVQFGHTDHIDLEDHEIFTLLMLPKWKGVVEFVKLVRDGKITEEQKALIDKMRDLDGDFVARVSVDGIEKTLQEYDKSNEAAGSGTDYTTLVRRHQRIADQGKKKSVQGPAAGSGSGTGGSTPVVAGAKDRAGKSKSTGDAGDKKPVEAGGALKPKTVGDEIQAALDRKELIEKIDEIELNPDAKKSQMIALSNKALKDNLITENQLEELKRISADRDMGVDDLVSELRSYVEVKPEVKTETEPTKVRMKDLYSYEAKRALGMAERFEKQGNIEEGKRLREVSAKFEKNFHDFGDDSRSDINTGETKPPDEKKMMPTFEPTGETDPVFERMLDDAYTVAAQQGMKSRLVRGALPKGSYSPTNRMVVQTVGQAIGSVDLRVAWHEIGHHVFSMLPSKLRNHIMRTIGKISDEALGVENYPDVRFQEGKLGELPAALAQEERLVASVEAKLTREGFNPRDASTYAQTFMRATKSALIRAALEVQRLFGFEANERLAREYFELSVKKFLAGDSGKFSYLDMLGLAKPSVAARHERLFANNRSVERLYGDDVIYEHQDNNTAHGAQFNIDNAVRYTIPLTDDLRATRTNMVEREVATQNHLIDLYNSAAQALKDNEVASKRLKEAGKSPLAWLRRILKLPNPELAKESLQGRLEPDGSEVVYNPEKRIQDFKDESNKDFVLEKTYRDAQQLAYKLDTAIRKHAADIQEIADKKARVIEGVANGRKQYADLDAQAHNLQDKIGEQLADMLDMVGGSKKRSSIASALKVLDQKNNPKTYAKAFERLVADKSITGDRMIKVLDLAASIDTIDFREKADAIRQAMRNSGKFENLLHDTPISRASLATVIAIGRLNPRLLAELELRRLPEGRADIEAKVDDMIEGKTKPRIGKDLNRQSDLESRVLAEYAKEAKRVRGIVKDEADLKANLEQLKLVEPAVNKRMDELTGQLGVVQDFTFKDGAEYHQAKAGMSTEDVMKSKEVLALDTSGRPTRPDTLARHALEMKRFLMDREAKFAAGDLGAKDRAYQRVQRQYQELAKNLHYDLNALPTNRWGLELYLMPAFARIADAFMTPAAQLFKRAGYRFADVETYLRQIGDGVYDKDYRMRRELYKLLPNLDDHNLQQFIDSAKVLLEEHTSDLVELHSGDEAKIRRLAYARVRSEIENSRLAKDIGLNKVMDRFMPTFEKIVEFEHEMGNKYYLGQVLKGTEVKNPITGLFENAGLKVKDAAIKVLDPSGEQVTALRRHTKKGWRTFGGRRMAAEFNVMANAMKHSDWESFRDKVGDGKLEAMYKEDPAKAAETLNRFFNSRDNGKVVQDWFLRKLAERDQQAMFDAPALADGETIPPADPSLVRRALNSVPDGDVMGFIEKMHDLHGAESDMARFVQQTADKLGEYWSEVKHINEEFFPDDGKTNPMTSLEGMTPGALVDSRKIGGLPSDWFSFYKFDKPSLHKLSRLISAEVAFGRNGEYLQGLMNTVAKEAHEASMKLEGERLRVRQTNPGWTDKQVEKEVKKMAGYEKLKTFEERAKYVKQTTHELSAFFRKDNSPEATLFAGTRFAQTISRLMVNNPASAIYQLATLFDPMFRYGVSKSTVKATTVGIKRHLEESVASLAHAVGIKIFNDSEFNNRFNSLNLQYPERIKRYGDEFRRWDNESRASYAARLVEEVTSSPINLSGKESSHVLFRPTGMFDWTTMIADKSLTDGMWNFAGNFTSKGIEFFRNNPEKLKDPNYKLTAADLGLGRLSGDKASFEQFRADMGNYGMDFDSTVRGAMQRGDGKIFTDQEALRLNSMAMNLVSSQSNIATMTPAAWNNNILRWMIPLLGWAWRRTLDVSGKRLGADGKLQAESLARGMAGIAAVSVGGLALSAIVDKYYEELVGRKRNLRSIDSALGVIEHTARVGSTGFFGEFLNGMVNVGTGGDNRLLSMDRRVVAVSSMMAIQNAVSNLINQQAADYSRVARPAFMAIGGNGLLQYMDMANNLFGLDNVESRVSNRINAQNYLRVVGRDLQMPVRMTGASGAGTPTPMTPYITQMELNAYANDAAGFRSAYQAAVRAATEQGFEDPVDHVKRAFGAKNPLRQVFSIAPSEADYQRILTALSSNGREAVTDAVANFNRYSVSIGGRPFDGRAEKKAVFTPKANPFASKTSTGTTGLSRLQSFRQAAFSR